MAEATTPIMTAVRCWSLVRYQQRESLTSITGYMGPNDENESDRLDRMHEMMLVMLDRKLCLAPISDSIHRALDLGTGTGIVLFLPPQLTLFEQ